MIPIQNQLIEIRKWPQYILAAIFFLFVLIIFDKPEHAALKIYFISGGLILFTLISCLLRKTTLIPGNEGITVTRLFHKTTTVKWQEIRLSGLSWHIEGHSAYICREIVSDNGKKIDLQPSFYSRENLRLIAESLIEKSLGSIIENRTRKIAEREFPRH